jgi:hypothetical protein
LRLQFDVPPLSNVGLKPSLPIPTYFTTKPGIA